MPGASIIGVPRSLTQLSLMDEQHLRFLYRRPAGLMSPDDARSHWGVQTQRSGECRDCS